MKYTIILITALFFSCSKEEQCKFYILVTESTFDSAKDKCNGLANSHPEIKIIGSESAGCLTSEELIQAKKAETTITKQYCNGVTYTIKTVIR